MSSEPSLTDIVAASGHVGCYWDLRADLLIWFGPWQKLFGERREFPPYNAENFAACVDPDDRSLVLGDKDSNIDHEYRLHLPEGRVIWAHEFGTQERDQDGKPRRRRSLIRVIDGPQRRALRATMEPQEMDALTGLPARATMLDQIVRLSRQPIDICAQSVYLVVGIDKMAFVNEAVGTESGDTLLRSAADRLSALLPAEAVLARVGGDMFGILLPGLYDDVATMTDRILQNFRDRPVATCSVAVQVTVSIGGVRMTGEVTEGSDVMIHAEQALREAQQHGRDLYVEYQGSEARAQETRTVLALGQRVKEALQQNGLKLAYQPVIDSETGETVFYEALARLFGPDGKMIPAADFIPVVEKQGLAGVFDRYVLNVAVREMEAHPSLRLAVNVSGITAAQPDWLDYVREVLTPRPALARRLIMEITETAAIMDVAETRRFGEALRQLGGKVSLDDFGAGFTSIRHLRTLPLSIMKIDRELILNLIGNPEQEHLVRMLIGMAHGLGLKIVAEGIETEDVAQWLRREKVDMMQGYYFGRPSLDKPWLTQPVDPEAEARAEAILATPDFAQNGPTVIRGAYFT